MIERKYLQVGKSREVSFKLTNSKEVLIFPEKSLNGVFKSAFRELLGFMKEVSKSPYLQYNEDQKNKFNPEFHQLWVGLITRRNINIIDEAEERLNNE